MSGDRKKSILRNRWLQLTVSLCIAVLFYLIMSHINLLLKGLGSLVSFITPVLSGFVLAYVMNPLANVFEDYVFKRIGNAKTRHRLAVVVTVGVVLLLLTLLLMVLIPQLFNSAAYLVSHLDDYANKLQGLIGATVGEHLQIESIVKFFNDILDQVTERITGNYDSLVNASVSLGKQVANYFIGFILAIYFLLGKEKLLNEGKRLMQAVMKGGSYDRTMDFLTRCHTILIRYIAFDIIDGLVVGLINYIFMKITWMPYAGLVSIVIGVTNLAPTFGPIVGCAIGAFILVLINPLQAAFFILFTILLQIFDGYIFKPRLFGATLGASPIWILVFIIVGGRMFGIWGILLAIPAASILGFVYNEMVVSRLEDRRKQRLENEQEEELKTVMQSIRDGISEMTDDRDDPEAK